jgi:transcriptional regulator GlxA family with amidase domain
MAARPRHSHRPQRARAISRSSAGAKPCSEMEKGIAVTSGFSDISYFNRCFRRRFGASPLHYRGGNGEDRG